MVQSSLFEEGLDLCGISFDFRAFAGSELHMEFAKLPMDALTQSLFRAS